MKTEAAVPQAEEALVGGLGGVGTGAGSGVGTRRRSRFSRACRTSLAATRTVLGLTLPGSYRKIRRLPPAREHVALIHTPRPREIQPVQRPAEIPRNPYPIYCLDER